MKKVLTIIGLIAALFIPTLAPAIETTSSITDREIVERLTKVETKLDGVERRIDSVENQIKQLREDVNAQFNRMAAIFTALVVAVIGFAIWDRRTMIRPFEAKVKKIEDDIAEDRTKLHDLIDAFRTLGKTDEKVADILKKFNLF